MEIYEGISIHGFSLFLEQSKTLVIGDLHIGLDDALHSHGFFAPKFHFKDLVNDVSLLLEKLKPRLVVLNGDIKHSFAGNKDEWILLGKFLDFFKGKCEVVVVKGNHDSGLDLFMKKKKIEFLDFWFDSDSKVLVCHGHVIPRTGFLGECKVIVTGHDHPAISLRRDSRVEKYKCFLKGRVKFLFDDKNLVKDFLVMPSASSLNEGSDIFSENFMSPFLENVNIDSFEVYVLERDVYYFGEIKKLRSTGHV